LKRTRQNSLSGVFCSCAPLVFSREGALICPPRAASWVCVFVRKQSPEGGLMKNSNRQGTFGQRQIRCAKGRRVVSPMARTAVFYSRTTQLVTAEESPAQGRFTLTNSPDFIFCHFLRHIDPCRLHAYRKTGRRMKAKERVHHRVGTYSDLRLGYQQVAIPLAVEPLIERNRIPRRSSIFSTPCPKGASQILCSM